jgi:hypothetical protein
MSVSRYGIYPVQGQRLGEFLCGLWGTACEALAMPVEFAARTSHMLRGLLPAWAGERIAATPRHPSYVAEDGFPAEMSVNWSGERPELRVLFDAVPAARGGPDRHSANRWTGAGSSARLASRRFRRVSEIFTPRAGRPSSAPLWHSMAWRAPDRVVHKTYFGLYAWPQAEREIAVGQAMERLGMAAAWEDARRRVARDAGRGGGREIEFFALDLASTAGARAKIYYRNHDADVHELNRMASVALTHDPAKGLAAYETLAGAAADAGEEALTCLAFHAGRNHAAEATTYLRMSSLASSDREAVDRTMALLRNEHVDPGPFEALATALAPGRLEDSLGMLELVSHRTARGRGDITTYFRFSVYDEPAPLPIPPVDPAHSRRKESAVNQSDLDRVARYNEHRQSEYASSELIRLLVDEQTPDETKKAVLAYLQPWSNAFQRMISARVVYETDPDLRALALEHQQEEFGHDTVLADTRGSDQRVIWDPVIEAGAAWFVDQFATLPGVQRAVLAHLALEAGSLELSKAGVRAFPDDPYFALHDEADVEHLDMGYQVLRQRSDWNADTIITVLDRAWQVITVVSDRIAECALRDTEEVVAA